MHIPTLIEPVTTLGLVTALGFGALLKARLRHLPPKEKRSQSFPNLKSSPWS